MATLQLRWRRSRPLRVAQRRRSRRLSVAVGADRDTPMGPNDGDPSARRTFTTLQLAECSRRFNSYHPATLQFAPSGDASVRTIWRRFRQRFASHHNRQRISSFLMWGSDFEELDICFDIWLFISFSFPY
nr:hypothetical protein CFP56_10782 [Quercus suber]